MALIKCTQCGHMVSDRGTKCPKCGMTIHKEGKSAENAQNADRKGAGTKKKYIVATLCCIALVVFGVSFWYVKVYQENAMKFKDFEITKEFAEAVRKYDEISPFSEGLAAVRKDNKWGFINPKGKEVIPCKYDRVGKYSDGLISVCANFNETKLTFIDRKDKVVLDKELFWPVYESMPDFRGGICEVYKKTEKESSAPCFIDRQGNIITIDQTTKDKYYAEVEHENPYRAFHEQIDSYEAEPSEYVGLKDSLDNVIVPAKYTSIGSFSNGMALAELSVFMEGSSKAVERRYGYVDKKGNTTFTEEDYQKFYSERKRQDEIVAERRRQEEERKRQGEEVIITMSADLVGYNEIVNRKCNIGAYTRQWDEFFSGQLRVPAGKVFVFKSVEYKLDDPDPDKRIVFRNLEFIVYDKYGMSRTYDARTCGEVTIFEGERVETYIRVHTLFDSTSYKHFDITYHFREIDKEYYY